jgi:nicotinate-nucleotide adenylyltransferase
MGEDNLVSLPKWKNYELLLRDYQLYVYPRTGIENTELHTHPHVHLTATPKMEISASFIRKAIKEGKSMQYFLDKKVFDFIQAKNLYKL